MSQETRVPFTEERSIELDILDAARKLADYEGECVVRGLGKLSVNRNSSLPDTYIHTIIDGANNLGSFQRQQASQ